MNVLTQLDPWVPMRDGVKLYAAIYRPLEGDRYPVLLLRSPFSTQHPLYVEWDLRFAKCGYPVVMQDSCGRIESEGKWRPYIDHEAPVRIFVMGQNAWRSEDDGPRPVLNIPGFTSTLTDGQTP